MKRDRLLDVTTIVELILGLTTGLFVPFSIAVTRYVFSTDRRLTRVEVKVDLLLAANGIDTRKIEEAVKKNGNRK